MNILLTGITGLVGASVVTALLRQYADFHIVALCRGNRAQSAQTRVEQTIHEQCAFDGHPEDAEEILKRITVISGDVTDFPYDEIAKHAPYDVMFHCAADVNLGKDPDGKVFETNLNGTKNALEAVRRFHIPVIHYVSTAYVAGKTVGRVMEDDQPAKDFVNPYERSKFAAEQLVRASGIPFTIYRPSIIVGRMSDGLIRKPLAFYRILEFFGRIKSHRSFKAGVPASAPLEMPLRLQTETSDRIYFVPVDYVQKAISTLFLKPVRNRTYHVTGDAPVTTTEICEAVSYAIKASGLTLMTKVEDPTPDEKLVMRMIGDLLPYFTTQITFDNSNIREDLGDEALNWTLGIPFLKKMAISYYRQELPGIVD